MSSHPQCRCIIKRFISWDGIVQLIFLENDGEETEELTVEHIMEHFDLSCCKCLTTDGKKMVVKDPFACWQGIAIRECDDQHTVERNLKYASRGFTILRR